MTDYKLKQDLIKLGQEIRQHTFWGLVPKEPEWDCTKLGAYSPTIGLPVFINNLTVKNGVLGFTTIGFEQFTKHTEIYEINATVEKFKASLQAVIESQTEKEFCQNLLNVLQTEVYFVKEWKD